MGNEKADPMPSPTEALGLAPMLTKDIASNTDVAVELAYERREVSRNLDCLEKAIAANPEAVSEHHKSLWRKQAEAMRAYKEVLGERIKDLMDSN